MIRVRFGQHLVDHINAMVGIRIKRKHRDPISV
jgi:hypothetical protein